uniref:GLOBIN domain-containing protein n=1 Tax=Rhabditophanes sp. KR3021 TaxID=114890 RepID=A0AC35TW90_9BILA
MKTHSTSHAVEDYMVLCNASHNIKPRPSLFVNEADSDKAVRPTIEFSNIPLCPMVDSPDIKKNKSLAGDISVDSAISMDTASRKSSDEVSRIQSEVNRLSHEHQDILKKTFTAIEVNAVPNGLKLLIRMFAEHPRYKNIWPQFRGITDSSLMGAPELTNHAKAYMKGLRYIIYSMQDQKKMYDSLHQIAKTHVKWNVHKHHVMHMLEQVLSMLADELGPLDGKTKESWSILYDVIANIIDIFADRV